jgi:hypothetical protein
MGRRILPNWSSPKKEILRIFLLGIAQKGNSPKADLIYPFREITCLGSTLTLETGRMSILSHVDQ